MTSPSTTNRFDLTLLKLYEKTAAGGLKWQTTADENSFRIGLGKGIVRINKRVERDGDELVSASLFDALGREVEQAWTWVSHHPRPEINFLPDLFASARRSALDIDNLLDSVEKDIAAGRATRIVDQQDDDIPF